MYNGAEKRLDEAAAEGDTAWRQSKQRPVTPRLPTPGHVEEASSDRGMRLLVGGERGEQAATVSKRRHSPAVPFACGA